MPLETASVGSSPVTSPVVPPVYERRCEPRDLVDCDLWMIDHHGSTVLRCRCVEASPSGMRLRVPLGYGINVTLAEYLVFLVVIRAFEI